MRANGHLNDEIDLDTKYKHNTEELHNMYLNAYTIVCPIRKVHLWADPEFTTHISFEESEEFVTKIDHKREEVSSRAHRQNAWLSHRHRHNDAPKPHEDSFVALAEMVKGTYLEDNFPRKEARQFIDDMKLFEC